MYKKMASAMKLYLKDKIIFQIYLTWLACLNSMNVSTAKPKQPKLFYFLTPGFMNMSLQQLTTKDYSWQHITTKDYMADKRYLQKTLVENRYLFN